MRKDQRMFCLLVLVCHLFFLEGSGIHLQSPLGEAWKSLSVWAGFQKTWNAGSGAFSAPSWLLPAPDGEQLRPGLPQFLLKPWTQL